LKLADSIVYEVIQTVQIIVKLPVHFLVVASLGQLDEFINVATEGLSGDPEEGDYDALVRIMSHLMRVRDREEATDAMFEPLMKAMELLKNYDEDLPEEVHLQFQARNMSYQSLYSFKK
jgi:hypothetical protein